MFKTEGTNAEEDVADMAKPEDNQEQEKEKTSPNHPLYCAQPFAVYIFIIEPFHCVKKYLCVI